MKHSNHTIEKKRFLPAAPEALLTGPAFSCVRSEVPPALISLKKSPAHGVPDQRRTCMHALGIEHDHESIGATRSAENYGLI
jgi:hypothetical protein